MGLDITVTQVRTLRCPHCGKSVDKRIVAAADSNGRVWYPFLEAVGYYVPYEKRTEENDWNCKDMELTKDQIDHLFRYCQDNEMYNYHEVASLVAMALALRDAVVINANW